MIFIVCDIQRMFEWGELESVLTHAQNEKAISQLRPCCETCCLPYGASYRATEEVDYTLVDPLFDASGPAFLSTQKEWNMFNHNEIWKFVSSHKHRSKYSVFSLKKSNFISESDQESKSESDLFLSESDHLTESWPFKNTDTCITQCEKLRDQCLKLQQGQQGQETLQCDNHTVYIFGDVHGRYVSLYRTLQGLGVDLYRHNIATSQDIKLVFLGDYVDRGYASLHVAYDLLQLRIKYPETVVLLRGNHEFADVNFKYDFLKVCQKSGKDFRDPREGKSRRDVGNGLFGIFNTIFETLPTHIALQQNSKIYFCSHAGARNDVDAQRSVWADLVTLNEGMEQIVKLYCTVMGIESTRQAAWQKIAENMGSYAKKIMTPQQRKQFQSAKPIWTEYLNEPESVDIVETVLRNYLTNGRGVSLAFTQDEALKNFYPDYAGIFRGHQYPPLTTKVNDDFSIYTLFAAPNYAGENVDGEMAKLVNGNVTIGKVFTSVDLPPSQLQTFPIAFSFEEDLMTVAEPERTKRFNEMNEVSKVVMTFGSGSRNYDCYRIGYVLSNIKSMLDLDNNTTHLLLSDSKWIPCPCIDRQGKADLPVVVSNKKSDTINEEVRIVYTGELDNDIRGRNVFKMRISGKNDSYCQLSYHVIIQAQREFAVLTLAYDMSDHTEIISADSSREIDEECKKSRSDPLECAFLKKIETHMTQKAKMILVKTKTLFDDMTNDIDVDEEEIVDIPGIRNHLIKQHKRVKRLVDIRVMSRRRLVSLSIWHFADVDKYADNFRFLKPEGDEPDDGKWHLPWLQVTREYFEVLVSIYQEDIPGMQDRLRELTLKEIKNEQNERWIKRYTENINAAKRYLKEAEEVLNFINELPGGRGRGHLFLLGGTFPRFAFRDGHKGILSWDRNSAVKINPGFELQLLAQK